MLSMRDSAPFITARRLIGEGVIGDILAIGFGGQHPLMLGRRPGWYFEPGKHGGTINDIGVHAIDSIPLITGLHFTRLVAARCWNALAGDYPHFQDAGQMMLVMSNGAGVLGDVSYFAPDSLGYSLPQYWRMTFWGRNGVLETSSQADRVSLAVNGQDRVKMVTLDRDNPGGYLEAFLADIQGGAKPGQLTTDDVLRAARCVLTIQKAADEGARDVPLPCQ